MLESVDKTYNQCSNRGQTTNIFTDPNITRLPKEKLGRRIISTHEGLDMYKLFAIALALSVGGTFGQLPSSASSDTVPVIPWVEPDVVLRVTPLMLVNQVYGVSISVKNTGLSDWMPSDVSLRQTSPSTTWFQNQYGHPLTGEENRVLLTQTVPAGGKAIITFQIRAPATSGHHELAWQFYNLAGPIPSTASSRRIVVATLQDVTPPGQPPPIDARPFPATSPPSLIK